LRAALAERVTTLYQAARTAAAAAHDAHSSESASRSSAQALSQTVSALETHATDAGAAVAARRASTAGALEILAGAAEHLRRAGRELRVRVEQLARRAAELAEASERLSNRAAQTTDADEGLELLASVAAVNDPLEVPGGGRIPASHAQATARRGRAALAELRREAESTATEHASIARELARATEDTSTAIREAPPQAVTVVRDAIGAHLTAAERAGELMGALASALARLQSARETGATAVAAVAGTHGALARALVDWDLGDELDRAWLVPRPSPDGEATVGLADVLERVATARQRIDALVREVEEDADRAVGGG
jgi:DNA repair exonuclease SbcCD ATPase subunit